MKFWKLKNEFLKAELKNIQILVNLTQWSFLYLMKLYSVILPLKFNIVKNITNEKLCQEEMFLALTDWHGGEKVHAEQIDGINEYNIDILKDRVQQINKWNYFHYIQNDRFMTMIL